MNSRIVFISMAWMLTSIAQAGVYKCTDAKGHATFQDRPCFQASQKNVATGGNTVVLEKESPSALKTNDSKTAQSASTGISVDKSKFVGQWCFFEMAADGLPPTVEKVDLDFRADGTYSWSDPRWRQTGTWKVDGDTLKMSNVGTHTILSVSGSRIDVERWGVIHKFRKGRC